MGIHAERNLAKDKKDRNPGGPGVFHIGFFLHAGKLIFLTPTQRLYFAFTFLVVVIYNFISSYLQDFSSEICDMAIANFELVAALRETAKRLKNGADYAWGHHGSCNCGNLLQVLTQFTKEEITRFAQTGVGEWTELAEDYCGVTNTPVDLLISELQKVGLTPTDIHNLEYLQDKSVLQQLPGGFRWLKKNVRQDVIVYFETFADILENDLFDELLRQPARSEVVA